MSDATDLLRITVYTDYKSPFAYLAKNATNALAVEFPVSIAWTPYTLRIHEYLDAVADRSAHNWRKVKYMYMDARRLANRQGLVVKAPKRHFDGSLSSMGMLFSQRHGFFDRYHDLTFERFWRRDLDIDSIDEMKGHIESLGGSPTDYEMYALGPGRDENRKMVVDAEESGVFGVPTFRIGDELFWGGDRIPMLRRRIGELLSARAQARQADLGSSR